VFHRPAPCVPLFFCVSLLVFACAGPGAGESGFPHEDVPVYGYELVNTYPHDPAAYTQGLCYRGGYLYESTGLAGHSTLRKVIPETGAVVKIYRLPDAYFGEGLTVRNDTIYQLTYRNHSAFTYVEHDTFALVDSFPYALMGWGLTHDDTSLISSDGSDCLFHLSPQTYEEVSRFDVTVEGRPQPLINEMEMIGGRIYANILGLDSVAIIVPETGTVEGWLNLEGLRDLIATGGVLNGIAWDPDNSRLFVTGKNWPHLFEVQAESLEHPAGTRAR
jgi:glutamine cyclotransferase